MRPSNNIGAGDDDGSSPRLISCQSRQPEHFRIELPRRSCAPIEKSTPLSRDGQTESSPFLCVGDHKCESAGVSLFLVTVPRLGPAASARSSLSRKTTSTFLPRHSHTLTRAPRTFSGFPAHGARFLFTRTHARRSLILHNCIFYCPIQTSLTIGHFICKLPKNNVANVCAILEGAKLRLRPIASPRRFRDGSTFRCLPTARDFFRHI